MSVRDEVETRYIVDGKPVLIKLINNPTIEDVMNTEARVQATMIERGNIDPDRRVSRELRDFLIRLGVEK
jgi:hypothetical protein